MSSSSNVVNFSLRQNKTIERGLVFDALQDLYRAIDVQPEVYIGFGSVWFSDFQLAHRQLGVETMVSIESDLVTFERAVFNKPFRTVRVVNGLSTDVMDELLREADIVGRPTVVWLDYDQIIDGGRRNELRGLASRLPENSVLISTFKVKTSDYAKPKALLQALQTLFEDDDFDTEGLDVKTQDDFSLLVGRGVQRDVLSAASTSGRTGQAFPAFFIPYRDQTPMMTVGVFLSDQNNHATVSKMVHEEGWIGRTNHEIAAPLLTVKEVAALQASLPSPSQLTREAVKDAGFDLEEERLAQFCRWYARYPSFAQVAH